MILLSWSELESSVLSLQYLFLYCAKWQLVRNFFSLFFTFVVLVLLVVLFIEDEILSVATTKPWFAAAAEASAMALLAFLCRIPHALQSDCTNSSLNFKKLPQLMLIFIHFCTYFREEYIHDHKYCWDSSFVGRFMGRKITLGPRGPLLQRGVVVVLQSAQTLAAAAALLLLLLWSDELISKMPCCWWLFCNFFVLLTGLFVAGKFGSTIFCINLIFEDIHCTGPLMAFLLPWSRPSWSLRHDKDNLSGFLLSSSTVDWKEGNGNAWGWSYDDPMSWWTCDR